MKAIQVLLIIVALFILVWRTQYWIGEPRPAGELLTDPRSKLESQTVAQVTSPQGAADGVPDSLREYVPDVEEAGSELALVDFHVKDRLGHLVSDVEFLDRPDSELSIESTTVGHGSFSIVRKTLSGLDAIFCAAPGFIPKRVELVRGMDEYEVILRRPSVLAGRVTGSEIPACEVSVIAFRSDIDARSVRNSRLSLTADDFDRVASSVCETKCVVGGSFMISGVEEGESYELAVIGSGLIGTRRRAIHEAGDLSIELLCAAAYTADIEVRDDAGVEVCVFSHAFHGFMSTTWSMHGSGSLVNTLNSSLVLSGFDSVFGTTNRATRRFFATSSSWAPKLDALHLTIDAPGFSKVEADISLDRIDSAVARKTLLLVRDGDCHGRMTILFGVEGPDEIPKSTIRLRDLSDQSWITFRVSNALVDDDLECSLENVPCGEYALEYEDEISGWRWPEPGREVRVTVASATANRCAIPLEPRNPLKILLRGGRMRELLDQGGLTISLGAASKNAELEGSKRWKVSDSRAVRSPTHTFEGVAPGRYRVVILGEGRVLADRSIELRNVEDWTVEVELDIPEK